MSGSEHIIDDERAELLALTRDLRAHLWWLRENGVRELPPVPAPGAATAGVRREPAAATADMPRGAGGSLLDRVRAAAGARAPSTGEESLRAPSAPASTPPQARAALDGRPSSGGVRSLEEIRAELGDCRRCRLCSGRRNIVFGAGNPRAELVFVGDAPRDEEDRRGEPFIDAAGELLTKMIEAMGLTRDEVYLSSLLKCRVPEGGQPAKDAVDGCEPFLQAQLASIQPKVIVALGKVAAQTLLRNRTAITELRGTWQSYQGIRLMPTYHPAYLLQKPADKKLVWGDLKQVLAALGREPPARG